MKKISWIIIVILAILVGLIPYTYLTGQEQGFLELKDAKTLNNMFWKVGFYIHIFSGGIAIMFGWNKTFDIYGETPRGLFSKEGNRRMFYSNLGIEINDL